MTKANSSKDIPDIISSFIDISQIDQFAKISIENKIKIKEQVENLLRHLIAEDFISQQSDRAVLYTILGRRIPIDAKGNPYGKRIILLKNFLKVLEETDEEDEIIILHTKFRVEEAGTVMKLILRNPSIEFEDILMRYNVIDEKILREFNRKVKLTQKELASILEGLTEDGLIVVENGRYRVIDELYIIDKV
ncbi:MAG: hypothetical protein ACFB0B_21305 [Thermonemataceae bacterium]